MVHVLEVNILLPANQETGEADQDHGRRARFSARVTGAALRRRSRSRENEPVGIGDGGHRAGSARVEVDPADKDGQAMYSMRYRDRKFSFRSSHAHCRGRAVSLSGRLAGPYPAMIKSGHYKVGEGSRPVGFGFSRFFSRSTMDSSTKASGRQGRFPARGFPFAG